MRLDEIIAHNKANIERCTAEQIKFIRINMPELREDENIKFLFKFVGFIHNNIGWTYKPGKVYKYVCTCLCWDKEFNAFGCFIQFGFNNRNRLRNKLQHIQKNNDDIVCRIISIQEDINGK